MPEVTCKECGNVLQKYYYEVDGLSLCPTCAEKVKASFGPASKGKRTLLALLFGSIGALLGAALFAGIAIATDRLFGLLAILVGLGAGLGVKMGSQNRGGLLYQLMGVSISYIMMAMAYLAIFGWQIISLNKSQASDPIPQESVPVSYEAPSNEASEEPPAQPQTPEKAAAAAAAEAQALAAMKQAALDASPWYVRAFEKLQHGSLATKTLALLLLVFGFIAYTPILIFESDPLSLLFFGLAMYYAWKANLGGSAPSSIKGPLMLPDAPKESYPVMDK